MFNEMCTCSRTLLSRLSRIAARSDRITIEIYRGLRSPSTSFTRRWFTWTLIARPPRPRCCGRKGCAARLLRHYRGLYRHRRHRQARGGLSKSVLVLTFLFGWPYPEPLIIPQRSAPRVARTICIRSEYRARSARCTYMGAASTYLRSRHRGYDLADARILCSPICMYTTGHTAWISFIRVLQRSN